MGSVVDKEENEEDMSTGSDVTTFVDSKIASKKVVVFSKPHCPFCHMAKNALGKYNMGSDAYEVIEISSMRNCGQIQDYLRSITGARTVPRVFIGGKCIGGGQETSAFEKKGVLSKMLQQAGAI